MIQWLCGFPDIRDCAPFSLHARLTHDFDASRSGTQPISSPAPRTVLLSIAYNAKEELLPSIQAIANNGIVLYATSGTHKFLNEHGVKTVLVHKISEPEEKPNLADLLQKSVNYGC